MDDGDIMSEVSSGLPDKKIVIGRKKNAGPPVPRGVSRPPSVLSSIASGQSGASSHVSQASGFLPPSASPWRGPRRYLPINQACSSREAQEVELRSKLIMRGLQKKVVEDQGSSEEEPNQDGEVTVGQTNARVQSPGRSQNPNPGLRKELNGIREDVSISPVPVRHNVVRNLTILEDFNEDEQLVAQKPKPKTKLNKLTAKVVANVKKKYVEASPDDQRASISFLPTPARLRTGSQSSESDGTEVNDDQEPAPVADEVANEEEEDAEPENVVETFKPPASVPVSGPSVREMRSSEESDTGSYFVTKAPSETSEVTFKMPTIPKPVKRKEPPIPTEVLEQEYRYLHSWTPKLIKNKLYVEGDLLDFETSMDASGEMFRRYMTSRIVARIGPNKVASKKRIYVLEGPLAIKNLNEEIILPPAFILDKFKDGFPENWDKLAKYWIRIEEQSKKNFKNMSLISSTMLSNFSTVGDSSSNFSNVSAIPSMNTSGWVKIKKMNLSVYKQTDVSVIPETPEAEHLGSDAPALVQVHDNVIPEESSSSSAPKKSNRNSKQDTAEGNLETLSAKKRSSKRTSNSADKSQESIIEAAKSKATHPAFEEPMETDQLTEEETQASKIPPPSKKSRKRNSRPSSTVRKFKDKPVDADFENDKSNNVEDVHDEVVNDGSRTYCSVCEKNVADIYRHSKTLSHKANLLHHTTLVAEDINDNVDGNYCCIPCNFATDIMEVFEDHMKVNLHKRRCRRPEYLNKKSNLSCKICHFETYKDDKLWVHFRTNKHCKNDLLLRKAEPQPLLDVEVTDNRSKSKHSKKRESKETRKPSRDTDEEANEPLNGEVDKDGEPSKQRIQRKSSRGSSQPKSKKLQKSSENPVDDLESATLRTSSRSKKKESSVKQSLTTKPLPITHNKPESEFVKPMPRVKKTKTPPQPFDSTLNQSSFGRVRKAKVRKSCVYNTPDETAQEKPVKVPRKRKNKEEDEAYEARPNVPPKRPRKKKEPAPPSIEKSSTSALNLEEKKVRRKVQDPFKKSLASKEIDENEPDVENQDSVDEILKKISAKPKTVKDRVKNAEALKKFNENFEDDMFGSQKSSASTLTLKTSTKTTLLSQDPESDSDQDISVHSARTPVTAYFGKSSLRDLDTDKTPGFFAQPDSPALNANNEFNRQAYIQRNLAERRSKGSRPQKKKLLASALTQEVSRSQKNKMVDQSTKVIESMGRHVGRRGIEEEDEPEDDWFDEEEENEENMLKMLRR